MLTKQFFAEIEAKDMTALPCHNWYSAPTLRKSNNQ